MASGQTPGPAPQGPYPPYQPMYQPPSKTAVEYMRPMVSDTMLAVVIALGLFLIWLGSLIWGLVDPGDDQDWGYAVKSVGMLLLTIALFVGGVLRNDLDKWMRIAFVASAVVLICVVGYWSTAVWSGMDLSQFLPW